MNQNRNPQQQQGGQIPQSGPEFNRGIAGSGKSDETDTARHHDLPGEAGPKSRKAAKAPEPMRRRGAEDEDRASGARDEDEIDERDRIGRSPRES